MPPINLMLSVSNEPAIAPYQAIVSKTQRVLNPPDIPKYLKNRQNPSCKDFLFSLVIEFDAQPHTVVLKLANIPNC